MSIFSQKMKQFAAQSPNKIVNPIDLFYNELIQQKQHDFLRDNQTAFLTAWQARRHERDIIGVMNTGAGKTLIGLLMLYSKIKEGIGPAVYLCPDNQLVQQVYEQAFLYGIPVCKIIKNENKRQEFPLDFINSKSVLITTFESLFNGKSIFGVKGSLSREIQEIGALLIDDAHECIKKARGKASIRIEKGLQNALYNRIFELFSDDLKTQGIGAYNSIIRGDRSVIKQIPYWSWKNKLDTIMKLLEDNNNQDNKNIFFSYDLIIDEMELSECYISGDSIEITPTLIPTYKIPAFDKAKHRYILSATLNNGYELISEMNIEQSAVENPIKIDNVNIGERLILAPKRYHGDIENDDIIDLCMSYSRNYNVVVIVPNSKRAGIWVKKGAVVFNSDNIINDIQKLKESIVGKPIVIVNRYDGMDLIDDMCRILVIDGMPTKEGLREKIEVLYRENSLFINSKKAQAIEQGLGRAVRSGTDHNVVILMGQELLKFIGTNNNKKLFSPVVQSQLEFGFSLVEGSELLDKSHAIAALKEGIDTCLGASEEWRHFHKQLINEAFQNYEQIDFKDLINIAILERQSYKASNVRNEKLIDENMQSLIKELNDEDKAWYTQLYAYLLYNLNPQRATDLQTTAYEKQNSLIKPLTPVKSKVVKKIGNQITSFKENVWKYDRGTDICLAINSITASLIYSPDMYYKKFEKAMKDLGEFLGFNTSQPDNETDDGPDNFWRGENKSFVIECKNNSINNISRDEANQMFASIRWYQSKHQEQENMIPIMMHRSSMLENNAHANGEFYVIDEARLSTLKENLLELSKKLSQKAPNSWVERDLDILLTEYQLKENQILDYYTTIVKER